MTKDDDCVSRQEVLNLIFPLAGDDEGVNVFMKLLDDVENLDKVEPERLKGKWVWKEREKGAIDYVTGVDIETGETCTIQVDNRHVEKRNYCSLCGRIGDDTFMNYCPNCGAYMKEEE